MGFFESIATGGLGDVVEKFDLTGSGATARAIEAQREAVAAANGTQRYIFDEQRKDAQPWRDVGLGALKDLGSDDFKRDFTMADYQADPGYQFRMEEGQKALERSAAARGGLQSGGTLKALARYSQGVASDEYNNAYNRFNADRDRRFNRLSSLAGIGQTANSQVAAAGQNYGNNVSQNQIGMGNAIGAANIAQADRVAGLLGQGVAGGSRILASDERLKTDIQPIDPADLRELRLALKPYAFKYKDPETYGDGQFFGVMAQDLEKSKLGKTVIIHDEHGHKMIDMKKAFSLFAAAIAEG